jgi:superfamily II DNA helicase RecQ
MTNHKFEQELRDRMLEWRSTLDDVYTLHEENTVPQSERMFKNGWGCINDKDIENLIAYIPRTVNELKKVPGLGPAKVNKYGEYLLEIIERCIAGK